MLISFVIPVYNEMAALPRVLKEVVDFCGGRPDLSFEVVVVNDGSTDDTGRIVHEWAARDSRIVPVDLLVNAGHQRALVAGLDCARGDAVICMDGDGQHPVSCVREMLDFWRAHQDFYVVQGARHGRQKGIFKNAFSFLFYRLMREFVPELKLIPGASDFRLLSRTALDVIRQHHDRYRNLRILLAYLKLPTHVVPYEVAERLGGETKYSWNAMVELGLDGVFAFSWFPLRIAKWFAVTLFFIAMGFFAYAVVVWTAGATVPGWTSLVGLITLLFSGLFVVLTFLGEYIKRIYEDVRGRPIYIAEKKGTKNGVGGKP